MSFALLFLLSFAQGSNRQMQHDNPAVQHDNPAMEHDEANYRELMFRHMEKQKYDSFDEQAKRQAAALEEHQFVSRFNHLIQVLIEFSDHYNKDHSVNIKKIKAVKKAWHDLEKTSGWFKLDEHGSSDHTSGTAKKTGAQ